MIMISYKMVFSLGDLVIFGGKPENYEIPVSFRKKTLLTSARLRIKQ